MKAPLFSKEFKKLAGLAKKWGGSLELVSEKEFDRRTQPEETKEELVSYKRHMESLYGRPYVVRHPFFSEAPFASYNLGIFWAKKEILTTEDRWYDIIHEMGHVFAATKGPDQATEYDFLGWEYALAKLTGDISQWKTFMKDYEVGTDRNTSTFGYLSPEKQQEVLDERLAFAKANKLVINNKPVAIR